MKRFHIKKDYYGGALMIFIGLSAVYASVQYNLGTLSRMGPGFFPCSIGALMAFTGFLIALSAADDTETKSAIVPVVGHPHQIPDLRGAVCIIGATLAFIVVGNYLGLLPATFAIVFISAMGDRENTVKGALILSAAMMIIATVVFWWALQLQLPLFKWGA
jgi:hypothetical protein